jgi:hypothetical protein
MGKVLYLRDCAFPTSIDRGTAHHPHPGILERTGIDGDRVDQLAAILVRPVKGGTTR